jgi:hypothetical protein
LEARRSPEAVILSAAKDLSSDRRRSFAALRMTPPISLVPFLKNLLVKGGGSAPALKKLIAITHRLC